MKKLFAVISIAFVIAAAVQLAACAESADTRLVVDETQVVKTDYHDLLGIHDNSWYSNRKAGSGSSAENPAYRGLIRRYGLYTPLMRGISGKGWKNALSAPGDRGYDTYSSRYDYGIAENLKTSLALNPDTHFVVGVDVDASADDAMDLVRFYTLMPSDSGAVGSDGVNYAQMRIDLGISEPLNVVCFELGNEEDMQYYKGSTNAEWQSNIRAGAEQYTAKCSALLAAMKSVNPDIKTSVHAYTSPHDGKGGWQVWNEYVISNLGEKVSYIVSHYYYHYSQNQELYLDGYRLDREITSYINKLPEGKRPKIYMSEHAVWISANQENRTSDTRFLVTGVQGTLATADVINHLLYRTDVAMATYHCMFGGLSSPTEYSGHCWGVFRPFDNQTAAMSVVGEYFKLAYEAFGDETAKVSMTGNIYCNSNTSTAKKLSVSAHKTGDGGLNLIFVNKSDEVTHNVSFSAKGSYSLEKTVTLTADSLISDNTYSDSDSVFAKEVLVNSDDVFSGIEIAPMSIVAVYLRPHGEESTDALADVRINSVSYGGSAIDVDSRVIETDAAMYENKAFAGSCSFTVKINGSDGNTVLADTAEALRHRIYCRFEMPESAPGGVYYIVISDGSGAEQSVPINYTAEPAEDSFGAAEVVSAADGCVRIHVSPSFGALCDNEYTLRIEDKSDGRIVFIDKFALSDGEQDIAAFLPGEAISGEYSLYAEYCVSDGIAEKRIDFDYSAPAAQVELTSLPKSASGTLYTFESLQSGDTLVLDTRSALNNVAAKIYCAVYDKSGSLMGTAVSDCNLSDVSQSVDMSAFKNTPGKSIGAVMIYVWNGNSLVPYRGKYIINR